MAYLLLADLVVIIHGGFVLFALLGGLIVLGRPRWAWLHIPSFLWAGFIELTGGICPLTPLENLLRARGGEAVYRGGFIDRYLMPLLYPDDLTQGFRILLGSLLLLLNAVLYAALWKRSREKPR